jgi:hypothetical protein
MGYADTHARAAALVAAKGATVTFTAYTQTYTPTTDTSTVTASTVTGSAIRVRGNPDTYETLKLIESQAPTLLFAPATYGDAPSLGAVVSWGGTTYTVRDVQPVAPDGSDIISRIVVAV